MCIFLYVKNDTVPAKHVITVAMKKHIHNHTQKSNYDFSFAHCKEGFDKHIQHSIRGYDNLLQDVVAYSRYFIEADTNVVDIGCSTGKLIQLLIEENQDHCTDAQYIGVELASGFHKDLENRHRSICSQHAWAKLLFVHDDIRNYDFNNCSFVSSIFTLQFMSFRHRLEVLNRIYQGLNQGAALIFAEKTVANHARIQEMLTFNYYDYKRQHFQPYQIMTKEKNLRHMMKPNTWTEILHNLQHAGWQAENIQPFWCNHMFVGAIAVK